MKLFFKIILFVGLTHVALSKDHRALRMSPTTGTLQPEASVQGDPTRAKEKLLELLKFRSALTGKGKHDEYAANHENLKQFLKTHIQGIRQNQKGKYIAAPPSNGFTAETLAQILADGQVSVAAEAYQKNVESGQKLTDVHFLALTKVRNDPEGTACLLPENPRCTQPQSTEQSNLVSPNANPNTEQIDGVLPTASASLVDPDSTGATPRAGCCNVM